ncbi:MAG: hypothetical protein KF869_05095 [Phycisphaeraceae bacterium]|nr:hypothetical protein [Phycisphaeraceae bacterium]
MRVIARTGDTHADEARQFDVSAVYTALRGETARKTAQLTQRLQSATYAGIVAYEFRLR